MKNLFLSAMFILGACSSDSAQKATEKNKKCIQRRTPQNLYRRRREILYRNSGIKRK